MASLASIAGRYAFLLAVFIYWGWDCALSVNEETKDQSRTPGRAGVMSTVVLVADFAIVSTAALAFVGPAFLGRHSQDTVGAMSSAVLGSTAGVLLLLASVLSIKSYLPASSSASSLWGTGGIFVIGAGALVIGVSLMTVYRWVSPRFFTGGRSGVDGLPARGTRPLAQLRVQGTPRPAAGRRP